MRFLCYNFLYNGVYVNPLKDADRLAPEERGGGGGGGGGWGQQAQAVETIPRRPVPFATWSIYDIITLWLKYTLYFF